MITKFLRKIYSPIYEWITNNSIRYTDWFVALQKIFNLTEEEVFLKYAMEYVRANKLKGDYLEFGVFEGQSFIRAFKFARMYDLDLMRFHGFDSFEGLPELEGIDAKGFMPWSCGHVKCDQKKLMRKIKKKMDMSKVTITPGWFKDTLNEKTQKQLDIKKAAVMMVDCDLYESAVPVMNFITNLIQNGALIIFSDWLCFRGDPNRGEQRAFREWLKKNPSITYTPFYDHPLYGKAFILHKKDKK